MIHCITSNLEKVDSIKKYVDNFIIVHLHTVHQSPRVDYTPRYVFEIYYQDGIALDDDYVSDNDTEYNLHPVSTITEALEAISDDLTDDEYEETQKDSDKSDEIAIISCCNPQWNNQVVKYLNGQFADLDSKLECLDLYRYMKILNQDRLVQSIKASLNTEFVYPEDPVSFSYALYQCITRMF